MYSHVIIGGGISGLYIGFNLLKIGIKDFIILEKSNHVGGKIYTTPEDKLELGPSIIHSNQNKIMNLIKDLNLTHLLIPLKGPTDTLYYNKEEGKEDSEFVKEKLERLDKKLFNLSKKNLNLSVRELCKKYLSPDDYLFYKNFTKDWFEVREQNALTSFRNIQNVGHVYKIKGGLEMISQKLSRILKDYIHLDYNTKSINYIDGRYIINDKYIAEKIYLCTSLEGAKKINFINIDLEEMFKIAKIVSCIRVYAKFREKDVIPVNIISNYIFRWCIKISENINMISYTDGSSASRLGKLGKNKGIELILEEISKCLGKKIDCGMVKESYFAYWKDAYTIIRSNVSFKKYKQILTSLPEHFYQTVIPVDFGLNQAWIESHLLKI